ncbi:MAG: glycoside hydrolase family 43 protein [Bacilli bacterium]|nr:glycoside hydrolase family 43 protein [Bacilli bacterium]
MRKIKYLFAFSAVALLSLTACNNNKNPYETLPEETDEELIEKIDIVESIVDPSKEEDEREYAIYGNVYLPDEIDGAKLSWWSSKPKIINPKQSGDIVPGEVNRPSEDTDVTLVAQIEKDGNKTKYEQTVTVKAAAPEIADKDYKGYLFCHFTGQEGNTSDEQIYFALADNGQGLKFTDMSNSPALTSNVGDQGVRDPFIYRSPEGDTYRIIATDLSVKNRGGWTTNHNYTRKGSHSITLWETHDLSNWGEPRLIEVAAPDAGMAWAPEMIYHEETGQYLIYFSSTICNEDKSEILWRDCIYYTTTRDFVHFGETKKFFKNQPYPAGQTDPRTNAPNAYNNDERKIIDASVIKIGDWYYLAAKDGDNHEDGGILVSRTQDLLDIESWDDDFQFHIADLGLTGAPCDLNNKQLEGPEWFHYNVADREDPDTDEIGLMGDMYMRGGGYLPLSTTDIEDRTNDNQSWKVLGNSDYSWSGLTKRHGSIMRLTQDEILAVKEFYNK